MGDRWDILNADIDGRDRFEETRKQAVLDLRTHLSSGNLAVPGVRMKPGGCDLFADSPDVPFYSEPLKQRYIAADICIDPINWKKYTLEIYRQQPPELRPKDMTPTDIWESGYNPEHARDIADALEDGESVPMPFTALDTRMEPEGTQEGRHRGEAARMIGAEWMNVRILVDLTEP